MAEKKAAITEKDDVAEEIRKLGLEAEKKSANELAASGMQLSIRDKLVKHAANIDKEQVKVSAEETAPKIDSRELMIAELEKFISAEVSEEDEQIDTGKAVVEPAVQDVDAESSDEGLEFIDPAAEERERRAKALAEK